MIYENNCLFLFEKDLHPDFRKSDINQINLKYFLIGRADLDKMKGVMNEASFIIYVDSNKRLINHLGGPRKGRVESY